MPILRRLYLPLLILLCALWSFIPIEGGDDFWAHAAIGRIFLETGHIPKSTVYLWSANIPWVFHAYGSGIIYAFLLRLGGPSLGPWICLVLNFALAIIPVLLIWRLAKKRAGEVPVVLVCLMLPALWFSSVRWRLRPEGFTVLFLTVTLMFLVSEKRTRWHYLGIAAMFVLWPNLHGGVLIGILTLWVGAIAEAVQRYFTRSTVSPLAEATVPVQAPTGPRIEWEMFGLAALCSILPLLCNPWGLGYRTVFGGTAATSNHISEWRQFWVYPAMNWQVSWGICALCVIAVAVWFTDRQKRGGIGAVLFMMCALWVSSRRHMWLTSTTCVVALAQSAALLSGERVYAGVRNSIGFLASLANRGRGFVKLRGEDVQLDIPMQIIAQSGTLVILICACIVNLPSKGFRAVGETVPIEMSQFLLSSKTPPGRTFNDYEYSAALEWFLEGKRPLYIDLINAYPPNIFDDWYPMAHADPKGLKMLADLKVDVIALRPIGAKSKDDPIFKLGKYLETAPEWQLIYTGVDGRVWRRRKLFNAPVSFNAGQGVRPQQLPWQETTRG